MDLDAFFDAEFAEHEAVTRATAAALREPFGRLAGICAEAVRGGSKILFFGNGGSAADSQHIAAELVGRFKRERGGLAAVPAAGRAPDPHRAVGAPHRPAAGTQR